MYIYDDAEASFLEKSFYHNLIRNMHREFKYIRSLELLEVLYTKV
jgi:hypothetical protein